MDRNKTYHNSYLLEFSHIISYNSNDVTTGCCLHVATGCNRKMSPPVLLPKDVTTERYLKMSSPSIT